MPRHTHPDRERLRRRARMVKAKRDALPDGSRPEARPRLAPPRCDECWTRDELEEFVAVPLHGRREESTLTLCPACLRERSASWRWKWKLTGRELPDREDRAA